MSWGAVIVAGGAIVGGVVASQGNKSAAEAQADSSAYATDAQYQAALKSYEAQLAAAEMGAGATIDAANIAAGATRDAAQIAADIQWAMYQQTREDQLPWLQAGTKALGVLQDKVYAGPGEFTESPGYQFRLDQGNANILSNQSATGNLASGRTLKALQEYGQDYASNEYQNFLNQYYQSLSPLQSLAGLGQSTATSLGQTATATGSGIASIYSNMGSNLASIYSNQGSQLSSIYGGLGNSLASTYMGQGNAIAQNYLNQGNIAASSAINNANIWSNVISGVTSAASAYFGNQAGSSTGYSYNPGYTYSSTPYSSSSLQYLPYNF